jgi:two-component system CheB/CheR fusion protein
VVARSDDGVAPSGGEAVRTPTLPFPVACAGASAGGLIALQEFLGALPPDTGTAFVVVSHFAPEHESLMAEILQRSTAMPVRQVDQDIAIEPDHVYVIPPGKTLVLSAGELQLQPRTATRGLHRPIDQFLCSLADEMGHKAIGIVLSGTATDGTRGLEEIKAAGGITFAQDETAEHDSMPRSAIDAGCVDLVLPPAEIAREIARISRHPLVAPRGGDSDFATREHGIQEILDILHEATGVDFKNYKSNTLHRRIMRRIVLHRLPGFRDYVQMLRKEPAEIEALKRDILISVTSFFRNPEAFEALKASVFPSLMDERPRNEPVRAWVVGCSTGEEAYSLAMAMTEYGNQLGRTVPIQLFATDLNETAVERARAGVYGKNIAEDVSPERLQQFFEEVDGTYRISKSIRDMCVFARQNVLTDPPFSRLDLVACRNVMIYLDGTLQERLIPLLHYALRPNGYLWLGSSETIGSYGDLFELKDTKHKIYVKRGRTRAVALPVAELGQRPPSRALAFRAERGSTALDPLRVADRMLLARYAPPCLLLDAHLDMVNVRGDMSAYLTPAPGRPSSHLMKMLRPELAMTVREAVLRALREKLPVRESLKLFSEEGSREVTVIVMPLEGDSGRQGACLVLFEEHEHSSQARLRRVEEDIRVAEADRRFSNDEDTEMRRLKDELASTRDYLHAVIKEQEAANEDLQSANEEVQSANEELQSINEELETSKEEIQSSNEELATVNDELQTRYQEQAQFNNDLTNLVSSVQMAIVMLGPDLRISRFTPIAAKLVGLAPTDVGRPLSDITLAIDIPDVEALTQRALEGVNTQEREVQGADEHWYLLRVRPYRTLENRIEGAVLVLVDIDRLKRAESAVRESEARFELLADNAPVLIWVSGLDGLQSVNRAYEEFVGTAESDVLRFGWTRYLHPEDRDGYAGAYLDACARLAPFEHVARFQRADGVYRWMQSVGAPRFLSTGEFLGYVGCTYDITESKEAQQELLDMHKSKDEFLAMLSHELRNPMAAMGSAVRVLQGHGHEKAPHEPALQVLERQMAVITRLVDDLLDVTRISRGKILLHREPVDLAVVVQHAIAATEDQRARGGQRVSLTPCEAPLVVLGDPVRLEQIFTNLLVNASKFTAVGGNAWVSLERNGPWAVVRVRDDGDGIAQQDLQRVFELFAQAHPVVNSGVGIGLTLAQRLVALHGGKIEARSPGRGAGTEIVVRLPLSGELPAAPPATSATAREPLRRGECCRVLVVDDNTDSAEMQAAVLAGAGHTVRTAPDGPSALEVMRDFDPQVALLDIGLPGENGYQVAARLREQLGQREMLLIALTGYGQPADAERSRAAGFDVHLTKPADQTRLLEKIADWARARGLA